jgi:hypothetical protein
MATSWLDALHARYDRTPPHGTHGPVYPHVGAAFAGDRPDLLRVMAIGINAYNTGTTDPGADWWRTAYRQRNGRFHAGVRRDLTTIAAGVRRAPRYAGLAFDADASVYLTNVVKRWSSATKAVELPEQDVADGEITLTTELDLLAAAARLPHLVVVFGALPWHPVCRAFGWQSALPEPSWRRAYQPLPADSPLHHHLNRVRVVESGVERDVVLVRVRHPSRGGHRDVWPERLIEEPEFRLALGDPPGSPPHPL